MSESYTSSNAQREREREREREMELIFLIVILQYVNVSLTIPTSLYLLCYFDLLYVRMTHYAPTIDCGNVSVKLISYNTIYH